jgi:hypothetical protein
MGMGMGNGMSDVCLGSGGGNIQSASILVMSNDDRPADGGSSLGSNQIATRPEA